MSKLSEYLKDKKIDARRLLVASRHIEALRPVDRAIRLARKRAKSPDATEADKSLAASKPRSGKPVSHVSLTSALAGTAVPPKTKTKIVRAVNRILAQRDQEEVRLHTLF